MTTVTHFVNKTKQPYGGFLPIRKFKKNNIGSGETLCDLSEENVYASIVGMVVDYLTRYRLTSDFEESFKFSIKGALFAGRFDEVQELQTIIDGPNWNKAVIAACELVRYDIVYRTGMFVEPKNREKPNIKTIDNITRLIDRTCSYLEGCGRIVGLGTSFELSPKNWKVTKGDCDFITQNMLIDLKVSVKAPTSKETMQILVYYILLNNKFIQ